MDKIIAVIFLVFVLSVPNNSYGEIGDTIGKFEESTLVNKFSFTDRTTKTLDTGEKAHLYKNKEGHLIEIIINNQNKIRKQSLTTYATKSGSQMKIVAPALITEFVNEASRGRIDLSQFNEMLNVGIRKRGAGRKLSGFNVEIILAELWGEYEGMGLVTVTITKEITEEKTKDNVSNRNNEIVCDLNNGVIGPMRIGGFTQRKDIIETMNGEPEKIEDTLFGTDYKYFNKGIIITVTSTSKISMLYIYYSDLEEFDGYYKKFKGRIAPLEGNENMQTIRRKFGAPFKESKDVIYGTPEFVYKKQYGELHFCFDKNGNLDLVTMTAD